MYDYSEARDADIRRYCRIGIAAEGEEWITTLVRQYCLEQILRLMGDIQPERDREAALTAPQTKKPYKEGRFIVHPTNPLLDHWEERD